MSNSAKTYIFYEGRNGEPKSQWQYMGDPIVPGCNVNHDGYCYAPPLRWAARAYSAKQGAFFVRNSWRTVRMIEPRSLLPVEGHERS